MYCLIILLCKLILSFECDLCRGSNSNKGGNGKRKRTLVNASKKKRPPHIPLESSASASRVAPTTSRVAPTSRVDPASRSTTPVPPAPTPPNASATVSTPQEETIASANVGRKVATSNKGKKQKSLDATWKVMRKFVNDQGEKKAACTICHKVLAADPKKNGTSSCTYHALSCQRKLEARLSITQNEGQQETLSFQPSSGRLSSDKPWVFNQRAIVVALAEIIIIDELPFRFVEHDGFTGFMIICCPKARLKEFFKNSCAGRVSITTDTWTSVQNLNYMCITAHYVGKDWKLHKKIINFTKITSHKGDDIGAKLAECLEEWGLKNVFTVTLDNASTNDVACTFLKEKLETWGTSFRSGRYLHVRCVAHIVNLVVNDGLNEIGMSVKRVRQAVRWLRSSGSREAKFHAQVTAQNVQSKRMVSLDCQTRWNSTFLMLDTALVYERVFTVLDAIDPTFKEDLFAIGTPTTEDWKLVRNLTKFLKFFHRMTKTASGTKYCTVHLFLGELTRLYNHLSKASSGSDQHLAGVAWNMKAKVEKYWDVSEGENVKMNKILYIALLFDPRHKMQMLEHCFELMYGALRGQQLKMLVKEELVKMFDMYRDALTAREGEQVQGSVAVRPMNTEEDEDYDDTFAGYDLQHKVIGNRAELDKYLDDAREGAGDVTEDLIY
ncbi:Zinc finger BED domain-containing protein RICESLEEPER 2 [Linum perenne]